MSQHTIESRLRDHYIARAAECSVSTDAELDDLVVTTHPESAGPRSRGGMLLAAAAAIVVTGGLAVVVSGGDEPAPASVPPTLAGETVDEAARRISMECLREQGMTVGNTMPDGGVPFTGPDHETTKRAAEVCEAVLEQAGLPGYTP